MSKLEQAARQALEALEVSTDWDVGARGKQLQSMKAITALREALKLTEDNISHRKLAEQAKQAEIPEWVDIDDCEEQKQDPVAIIEKEAGFETEVYATGYADSLPDGVFKLYTHPVRTKDLTDTELMDCRSSDPAGGSWLESARAVIAADREKNRG